jgi:hypothetical protein
MADDSTSTPAPADNPLTSASVIPGTLGSADPSKPYLMGTSDDGTIEHIWSPQAKATLRFPVGTAAKMGIDHIIDAQQDPTDLEKTPAATATVTQGQPENAYQFWDRIGAPARTYLKPGLDALGEAVDAITGGQKQVFAPGSMTPEENAAVAKHPNLALAGGAPLLAGKTAFVDPAKAVVNAARDITPDIIPGGRASQAVAAVMGDNKAKPPAIPPGQVNLRGTGPDGGAPGAGPAPTPNGTTEEGAKVAVKPGVNARVPGSPDDIEKQISDAAFEEKGANTREADLKARESDAEAQVQNEGNAKVQASLDKQAQDQAAFEKDQAARQQQLDGIVKDVMSTKIDPNHLWHSQSTGQSIALILGNVLSGFGAGLAGHQAANMIDDAITRDVDAQKDNLENKKAGANMLREVMNDRRLGQKDRNEAAAAVRNGLIDLTKSKVDALAKQYGGPLAMANADKLNAQLDTVKAKNILEARKGKAELTGQHLRNQGQALENEQRRQGMALAEYYRKNGIAPPGTPGINVEGQKVYLGDKQAQGQMDRLTPVGTSYAVADKDLGQLENVYDKHLTNIKMGGAGYGPMVAELAENVANHIGHAQGLRNVPSAEAIQHYAELLKDPKILSSPEDMKRVLRALRSSLETGVDAAYNQELDFYGNPIPSPHQVRMDRARKALEAAGAKPVASR